jgi:hypothetical protein
MTILQQLVDNMPDITEVDSFNSNVNDPAEHATSVLAQIMGAILLFGEDLETQFPLYINMSIPLFALAENIVVGTLLSKGYQPRILGHDRSILEITRKNKHIAPTGVTTSDTSSLKDFCSTSKTELSVDQVTLHHNVLRSFVNSTTQGLYALIEQSRLLTTDPNIRLAWNDVLKSLRTVSDAIFISEKNAIKRAMKFEDENNDYVCCENKEI